MGNGFNLGQILGIKINIDFSWIFIFLLVAGSLVLGVFPQIHPEWGIVLSTIVGLAASFLFFASVLAHELAHSLVAKSQGLPVSRITLFLFGGISDLQKEPSSPRMEFLVAAVGPATSIALGVFFYLLGTVVAGPSPTLSSLSPVATLLLWLGPINILLGVFNLIPGFPLDGGRLLRAFLWSVTGSLRQATAWASTAGQGVGWILILIGILMVFGISLPILGSGLIGGLWLVFIGWFLRSLAAQSYQQVATEETLANVPVSKVMQIDVQTVPEEIPVSELVDNYITGRKERIFPVMDNSHLAGLVSLEDVRKVPKGIWGQKKVGQIMTPAAKMGTVSPEENANNALNKLTQRDVNQLPVVKDGSLVGILSRHDILLWLQLHADNQEQK